ncbi:MAG: hypothetical protein ACRD0Q_03330 [Acidimicrobiales bacterium]
MTERRQQTVCASLVAVLLVAGAVSVAALSGGAAASGSVAASGATVLGVTESTVSTTTTVVYDLPVSTTSTAPTTSTTRPRPVTTPSAVPRPASTQPPSTAFSAPPPVSSPAAERCEAARVWVTAAGLRVPAGWDYRCPDLARDDEGAQHWGIACWNCDGGSYVGVNIVLIGPSDATLRYVVAHETCHAIEFMTLGLSTELTADLCAALHGAPRP